MGDLVRVSQSQRATNKTSFERIFPPKVKDEMIDEDDLYNGFHTGEYVLITKKNTSMPSFGTIVRIEEDSALIQCGNNELLLSSNDFIGFDVDQVNALNVSPQ